MPKCHKFHNLFERVKGARDPQENKQATEKWHLEVGRGRVNLSPRGLVLRFLEAGASTRLEAKGLGGFTEFASKQNSVQYLATAHPRTYLNRFAARQAQ